MNKEAIVSYLRQQASRPLRMRELSKAMSVPADDYGEFRQTVKQLLASGELVDVKGGRLGLPDQLDLLVGRIAVTKSGTGFLIREKIAGVKDVKDDGDEVDILVPAERLSTALDGDRVLVRREGMYRGREAGSVIKILKRARQQLVGVFHKTPHFNFIAPDEHRIHRDIYIPAKHTLKAKQGQKVLVELEDWDDPHRNPEGRVIEILGKPGSPRVDLLSIVRSYGLTEEFPKEIERQAAESGELFTEEEIAKREDFRGHTVYTIDPADAKDHDDAIHVERLNSGFRLGVHIADVSFFVRENTMLDAECFERGNSTYLPGKVIPMLPEQLSNDLCSLREGEDRLAQSVIIDFDSKGKPVDWRVSKTVIRSCAKLSYEEAQSVFDGAPSSPTAAKHSADLKLAQELSRLLFAQRSAAGSLDFDLPEPRIDLDESGEVVSLSLRVRLEAHRLVEEFMLAANQAVALMVSRLALPMLYRVHDRPDLEKLQAFAELAESCGHHFVVSDTVTPRMVQRFLESIKGSPEEAYLSELALRSMKKAAYQPQNIGHFGLAFKYYTHFTSPIRRYPDLLVHRLLSKLSAGRLPQAYAKSLKDSLQNIGDRCSENERNSEKAERQAIKMMQTRYLADHVGQEFGGIISGVVARGFFVRLDGIDSDGMVTVSSLADDFYHLTEGAHQLVGNRKGRVFRLGDQVRVQLIKVDVSRREIDLELVEHEPRQSQANKKHSGEKRLGEKHVARKRVKVKGRGNKGGSRAVKRTGKKVGKKTDKKTGKKTSKKTARKSWDGRPGSRSK